MSFTRGRGLVCDGCGASIREDDVTVVQVRLGRQLQMNRVAVEVCALCASKERASGTLLGKFLSDPFCRKPS